MRTVHVKIIAALLLAGSLVLPQSTCSGYRGPDGTFVTTIPRDAEPDRYQPAVERHYAYEGFSIRQPETWVNVLAFLWPVPLLVVADRRRQGRLKVAAWIAEPVVALGSAWFIWFAATLFMSPAIGAYVALGAIALHLAVWLVELWMRVRARRLRLAGA